MVINAVFGDRYLNSPAESDPGRFNIFGVSDEQYTTALGNGSIPRRLAQRLTSDLSLGQRLSAVTERKDGRYALTFTAGGRESDVLASQVILTLPFTLLRQVDLRVKLPPAKGCISEFRGRSGESGVTAHFHAHQWAN